MKKKQVNVAVDAELLEKAEHIFKKSGLTVQQAVGCFLAEVVSKQQIPWNTTPSDLLPRRAIQDSSVTLRDLQNDLEQP